MSILILMLRKVKKSHPMKKYTLSLIPFLLASCGNNSDSIDYSMNMNDHFEVCTSLEKVQGKKARVIALLGQSNATGCSLTAYLKDHVTAEKYQEYEDGYEDVRINYCLDDHSFTSYGQFVKTNLDCGAGKGFFGSEVSMAETLSQNRKEEEDFFILKYTMSGYSLNFHWLTDQKRGTIYQPCVKFLKQYLTSLQDSGYQVDLTSICWMQGESDTTEEKAKKYYNNQVALASYLREDLKDFSEDGIIYFIDAGISNSPYCEPGYPTVNQAKKKFSENSPYNIYFSTIDLGFTVDQEPTGDPDWGHYDSMSEIALGHRFAEEVLKSF